MNRKLIRPTLAEVRERAERDSRRSNNDQNRKRVPPEQTHAESFYYKKQMDNKTRMVLVLQDGELLRGTIEWYDRNCIKLHRAVGPNLLVLKHNIKYIHKDDTRASAAAPAESNAAEDEEIVEEMEDEETEEIGEEEEEEE
jgi:host factor-I protein